MINYTELSRFSNTENYKKVKKSLEDLIERCFGVTVEFKRTRHAETFIAYDTEVDKVVATATINYLKIPFERDLQGYISYVCCDPEYRRQGITFKLIETLCTEAHIYGCDFVFLDSKKKGRRAAHKLYKKLKFDGNSEKFFIKEL